jgi:hypothetical protein
MLGRKKLGFSRRRNVGTQKELSFFKSWISGALREKTLLTRCNPSVSTSANTEHLIYFPRKLLILCLAGTDVVVVCPIICLSTGFVH